MTIWLKENNYFVEYINNSLNENDNFVKYVNNSVNMSIVVSLNI